MKFMEKREDPEEKDSNPFLLDPKSQKPIEKQIRIQIIAR
jgi:hypothetical protein